MVPYASATPATKYSIVSEYFPHTLYSRPYLYPLAVPILLVLIISFDLRWVGRIIFRAIEIHPLRALRVHISARPWHRTGRAANGLRTLREFSQGGRPLSRSFFTQQVQQLSLRLHPVIARSLHTPTNVDLPASFRANPRLLKTQRLDPQTPPASASNPNHASHSESLPSPYPSGSDSSLSM